MVNKAFISVLWSGFERFSVSGMQFVITIIIARILSPSDFGLIAMLTIFYAFSQALIDSGLSAALIQKQDCKQEDYNSVYFFNIIISLLMYLILFISASQIADFYNNDLLVLLVKVYSLNIVINSLTIVQRTIMMKKLMFKQLSIISFVSSIIAGFFAILFAFKGYSYWALVIQMLISSIISGLLILIFSKWKPSFKFSQKGFRSLFNFGMPILFISIINSIYNNIYSLFIGAKYSANDLGLYSRAYSFSSFIPVNFGDSIVRALFPIFSRLQNNLEELKKQKLMGLHIMMIFVIPINMFIIVNAEDVIILLLGENWIDMTPFLQILCFSNLWYPLINLNNNTFKVLGKTKFLFKSELFKKFFGISILLGTLNYGIITMVVGQLIYSVLDVSISLILAKKIINISIRDQLKQIYPLIVFSSLSLVFSFLITRNINVLFLKLIISGVIYMVLYFIMEILNRKDIKILIYNMLKNRNIEV